MNILAVSDLQSRSLENLVSHSPEQLKKVDLIFSCGDLDKAYLEFLVDGLNRDLLFVSGNHVCSADFADDDLDVEEKFWSHPKTFPRKAVCHIAGTDDLHGRVEKIGNYLIVGFGGSLWYNGKGNQYAEKEMARIVAQVRRMIRLYRLKKRLLFQSPLKVIVISHAPIFGVHDLPDICHTGFKCFLNFLNKVEPLLWVHGHVHLPQDNKNQVTLVGKTTVVNASGYKFISIDPDQIQVSYRNNILDK